MYRCTFTFCMVISPGTRKVVKFIGMLEAILQATLTFLVSDRHGASSAAQCDAFRLPFTLSVIVSLHADIYRSFDPTTLL